MPSYAFHCKSCNTDFDVSRPMSKAGDPVDCQCGSSDTHRIFECNFVLRGQGWPGKKNRVDNQKKVSNARLDHKMNEKKRDGEVPALQPNVNGERTDSWGEAAKLAASKGYNPSGYQAREHNVT